MNIELPKDDFQATSKTTISLRQVAPNVQFDIISFEDATVNRTVNNVVEVTPQARLTGVFPEFENKHNKVQFTLRFPNLTVQDIAEQMYLFSLKDTPPKANTKLGKYILSLSDKDGVVRFDSIEDFALNYKMQGSVTKLHSILRENEVKFVLADLSKSLVGQSVQVQTVFNSGNNDYSIVTTDHVSKPDAREFASQTRQPRAKATTHTLYS